MLRPRVFPGLFSLLATLLLACFQVLAAAVTPAPGDTTRPQWPQGYSVKNDAAAGVLTLSTPFYSFTHDLHRGGALSAIRLTHGRAENLLAAPAGCGLTLADSPAGESENAVERESHRYTDLNCKSPQIKVETLGKDVSVTVECPLLDTAGKACGVSVRTRWLYRWGHVKIHREFIADSPVEVRNLWVLDAVLDPSLTDYGYRPALGEMMSSDLFGWVNGQIRQWGKIRPGTHLDLPLQMRHVPRYLVFANPGVEGLEWFVSDDLAQWDYQTTGTPGNGFCQAEASLAPRGIALHIYPLMLSDYYVLPEGGKTAIKGNWSFDYYLAVPVLSGHAEAPWLNAAYKANGGAWISADTVALLAEKGLATMHLHNDGDHLRDGLFWRDGSYPPYPSAEMKKMDRLISAIHKAGMKTAPYFSCHELYQSTPEFEQHGKEWGRTVDDRANLRPNTTFGAHMCLKSGWLGGLEASIDRVLSNHDFDGVYYDWNIAMFCANPLHVGHSESDVAPGVGSAALSPLAHWDIDELIEFVEWSRRRVGPGGVVMLHNTLVPMFATENFADYVVGMEFSYGMLSESVPPEEELPLEWNFAGARSRAVITYGLLTGGASEKLKRRFALTCLATGVAPWPATLSDLEVFSVLKPLGRIEDYRREDYRSAALSLERGDCLRSLYSRPGEAWVLLAEATGRDREIQVRLEPSRLPSPLGQNITAELIADGKTTRLDAASLCGDGASIPLAADSAVLLHLSGK